ncbi:G-type lectin S-receptor-like serine/threonine-protein kinase [Cardamine amara subsp. amara]|uniref:Receptor-like serine/threonine-protein kinase n=1 Tax=Cardamine amara subsp. amara TaxID=228776 RepID=A0ABD1AZ64_CARAN
METCKKKVLFIYYCVLMFLSFQVSDVSSATDTISTNQPLVGSQRIVSSSDIFELGFFYPYPGSLFFYIGMWYKHVSPQTFVWVANQESLVRSPYSKYFLKISNGNLILQYYTSNEAVWSTRLNSNSSSKDVQAVLFDNGNLVLRDGPKPAVLWQSFNHPSHTWLRDAKFKWRSQRLTSWQRLTDPSPGRYSLQFDPKTQSLVTVWNGSKSYWSSGPWDDRLKTFKGFPDQLRFELNLSDSYITYSPVDQESAYRLVMDFTGQFKVQSLTADGFHQIWAQPEKRCEVYNYCGSFGICNVDEMLPPCECVPDFKLAKQALPVRGGSGDSNDFSGGCIREATFQCGNGKDMFTPLKNMKLASDPTTTLVLAASLVTTCASACVANCSCDAYAYDGKMCFMWTKNAFNLQRLDANQGHTFFLRVSASNISQAAPNTSPAALNTSPATLHQDKNKSRDLLEGSIIDDDGEQICHLNLGDIMAATNAFSDENKLGEGGFGPVYKGKLPNGMDVAIKRLSKHSSQGLTEFKNEVILIIKLQHKNLVRLLGYCVEGDEKLLIYEYMPNKSLDVLLFDSLKCRELDWEKRMKIINGTTRGLQYLHEDSRHRIIHRDLKASNILLDDEMNPKISDFGTARIFGCKQIDDSTQRIVGTFGYMSPEYALGGVISEKSDIYSFGVLLLEIISGKKATRFVHNDQKYSLVAYAWESWCETEGVSIIDEALCGFYSLKEVMSCVHIALLCVQDHPKDRPTISQIVYMLSNDNNLPIPKQPTFSNVLTGDQQSGSSKLSAFSINEATQTEIEAR